MNHTPLPLDYVEGKTLTHFEMVSEDGNRSPLFSTPKARKHEADQIYRAVNNHQKLVDALKSVNQQLSYYVGNPSAWPDGYSEMMSNIIRDGIEEARALLAELEADK